MIFDIGHVNVRQGDNCKISKKSNLYDCVIGDNVFVGPFSEIQKGVLIGSGTRIQSHSFICEFVTIGKNCFIGHGVMFTNDLFKGMVLRVVIRACTGRQQLVIMSPSVLA